MSRKKRNKALNLTPLIDVMTTLIIFILIQSSDSPVEVKDQIKLTKSEYGQSAKKNEVLSVGLDELRIGDDYSVKLQDGKIPKELSHKSEPKLIESLYKKIKSLREQADKKEIDISLSFDKRTPSTSVKKIIYTVTMAGANNIYYIGEKR